MEQAFKVYRFRWVVLVIFMYLVALSQLYWLNFAAIETYVEDFLKIPPSDAMWLTLVQPVFMILLTMPAGIIIDRIGLKWGVGIGHFTSWVPSCVFSIRSFMVLLIGQIDRDRPALYPERHNQDCHRMVCTRGRGNGHRAGFAGPVYRHDGGAGFDAVYSGGPGL
jgi:hypothetical protein